MTFPFDATNPGILVEVQLTGPLASTTVYLALDTGATETFINAIPLAVVGYSSQTPGKRFNVVTANGVVSAIQFPVVAITALGQTRTSFPVMAHTLPPGAGFDGVLGLDFLRGNILTIDFINCEITLTPGSSAGATP